MDYTDNHQYPSTDHAKSDTPLDPIADYDAYLCSQPISEFAPEITPAQAPDASEYDQYLNFIDSNEVDYTPDNLEIQIKEPETKGDTEEYNDNPVINKYIGKQQSPSGILSIFPADIFALDYESLKILLALAEQETPAYERIQKQIFIQDGRITAQNALENIKSEDDVIATQGGYPNFTL